MLGCTYQLATRSKQNILDIMFKNCEMMEDDFSFRSNESSIAIATIAGLFEPAHHRNKK